MESKDSYSRLSGLPDEFRKALEHERWYHHMLDHMAEGLQILDRDWRYLYVNDTVLRQSRKKREDLLGHTMPEVFPGITGTEMFGKLSAAMDHRRKVTFENQFRYEDGTQSWFELRVQPMEEGLLILSLDINDRKMAEERQREYNKSLELMLFMTSHKVRAPVTQILGIAWLFESKTLSGEETAKLAGYLQHSAKELDDFTRELTRYLEDLEKRARTT